jgi:hypothetical protein
MIKKNTLFNTILPHGIALVIFIAITLSFFSPILNGKKLNQGDIVRFKGMSKEIVDYREKTGEEALWTNSMFGGMPAYQISLKSPGDLMSYLDDFFKGFLPHPADLVFIYMIGFYILLLSLGVNPWMSIIGSFAFAFSSYFIIIIEAGHNSKAHAIGYMAPVIAGVILTYRKKYIIGGLLTLVFMAMEIHAGHPQITYYLLISLLLFGLLELYETIRHKTFRHFMTASAIVIMASLIAAGPNSSKLLTTYEYSKTTIRGKTELSTEKENRTSGLDKDYATQWSYGKAETGTLLIPDFNGGASGGKLSEKSAVFHALIKNGVPKNQARSYIKSMPTYWGPQPFVSGPVYAGAIIFFLFVLGLVLLRGKLRWWILSVTILSILLSWGKNFMFLTDIFFDYVPLYNKFRTVSMILVLTELMLPLLGFVILDKIFKNEYSRKEILQAIKIAGGISLGFTLIFMLFPTAFFGFQGNSDGQLPDWLRTAIVEDRIALMKADAMRSFLLIALSIGAILAFIFGKLKSKYSLAMIAILVVFDLWGVNKRYLNDDDYVSKRKVEKPYPMTRADQEILKDKDPNYRVFNLTVSPFNDASTSYYHKSIGGYHGAKLRRYQELIDAHISKFNMQVLNMLNTKYIIQKGQDGKPIVQKNPDALGNAWFVQEIKWVNNADEELAALNDFDPQKTAVIDIRYKSILQNNISTNNENATIRLTSYDPKHLVYEAKTDNDLLAVFSEIYYDKGWKAFIDGQRQDIVRADYVLRAMFVPKGKHNIEFRFEPESYITGEKIAWVSSILIYVLLIGGLLFLFQRYKKKK